MQLSSFKCVADFVFIIFEMKVFKNLFKPLLPFVPPWVKKISHSFLIDVPPDIDKSFTLIRSGS